MKTNKIKFFFCIITFCFLVTSCKNLLSELTQQKTYIQISTNLDTPNQRTVLPDFSVVQEKGYTWELYSDGIVLQTWNDDEDKSAYQNMCGAQIEVDHGSYSFELKVIKEDKIIIKSESQTVTIEQNKNNVLNFVLYPPTENEADGSVNFILKFPNEKVNIVEANLFKPDDDKKETVGSMPEVEISPTESLSTANITVNNVPAGSYLLQVDLCYQVGDYSRKEPINTYSTIVQVAAGFCSKAEVTLKSLTDYYTITYKVNDEIITTFQGSNEIPTTFKKNSNVRLQIACNSTNQISIGWFKDKDCTEPVELNSDDTFTITENTTLYTQWGNVVQQNDLLFGKIDADNNTEGLLINSKTGLNYFRDIVNGTLTENIIVSDTVVYRSGTAYPTVNAKLCSDIELSTETEWVPIGNSTNYYQGTFDGNGKCVTNLNITTDSVTDLGFFGYVQDATIKNLYVEGNISATNDSYSYAVGGIVGYAKSSAKSVTISNCINNVKINSQSTFVGGILGNLHSNSEITIESCVNIAKLTAQYPSGILNTYGNSTINNCLNLGNLTSNSTLSNLSAGICMTYNVNCSVSNCINTGSIISDEQCYPILCYSNNTDGSNPTCSNCFYDSEKIQKVVQGTPGTGKVTSWFYTEDTNSEEKLSDWSFASGRYPLPSTLQSIFDDGNSSDDVWAKLCKAAETGITTWSALASAIEDENSTQSEFVITNNLVATETIEISRPIKIIGSEVTITRGDNFTNEFFKVAESNSQSASLTIQGSENKNISFDGSNKTANAPFINFAKELTVSNCTFQNNTNSQTDGGAIYSKGNFSATNCTFINNHTNGSNMSGGAIAIYDDATVYIKECTLKNNSSNFQNGGGALYIQKNNSSNFVNINNSSFENNGANAIYVHKGSLSISSVTMKENTTTINGESTTRDIYVYDIQPNGALEFDGVNSEILMNLCFGTDNNVNAKKIAVGSSFSMAESKKITVEFSGTTSNNFSIAADKPYFSFDDDIYIEELVNTVNENFIFRYQNTTYTLTAEGKLTSSE